MRKRLHSQERKAQNSTFPVFSTLSGDRLLLAGILLLIQSLFCRSDPIRSDLIRILPTAIPKVVTNRQKSLKSQKSRLLLGTCVLYLLSVLRFMRVFAKFAKIVKIAKIAALVGDLCSLPSQYSAIFASFRKIRENR